MTSDLGSVPDQAVGL